jgi:transcriptional regulator with XRE-family HTH domain
MAKYKSNDLTESEIVGLLAAAKGGQSLEEFAPKIGVSFQYVARVLQGNRAPGKKVLAWLGYKKKVRYEKVSGK